MIFGNKNCFALEVKLNDDYGDEWLYGKFGIWLDNKRFGSYEEGTSLQDLLTILKWVVYDAGNRTGGNFCNYPDEKLFRLVNSSLYGNTDCDEELAKKTVLFDVSMEVDVCIGIKMYLLTCKTADRLLLKDNDSSLKVINLELGYFDGVIKEVYEYLSKIYEHEVSKLE